MVPESILCTAALMMTLLKEVLKEHLERMWPLVLESEKLALAAEAQIRRELLAGK